MTKFPTTGKIGLKIKNKSYIVEKCNFVVAIARVLNDTYLAELNFKLFIQNVAKIVQYHVTYSSALSATSYCKYNCLTHLLKHLCTELYGA